MKICQKISEILSQVRCMPDDRICFYSMLSVTIMIITITFLFACFVSCTLSFQNFDTHGKSEDLVDEDLKTNADISPHLEIPIKPL